MLGSKGYYLICVDGQQSSGLVHIPAKGLSIGFVDCDITIPDATGKCKLSCQKDIIYINIISGMVNLNGSEISERTIVPTKSIIKNGTSAFMLEYIGDRETQEEEDDYFEATREPLTGALNKISFRERVNAEIAFSLRHCYPASILLLEIDLYDTIKATYGTEEAEKLLIKTAQLIDHSKREEDIFASLGGPQLILFLRDSDSQTSVAFAERLLSKLQLTTSPKAEEINTSLTVSIGICTFEQGVSLALTSFIHQAMEALSRAQYHGGNKIHHCNYTRII